jgi:hypothetical protein
MPPSPSSSPRAEQHSQRELRVLVERPELCLADAGGTLLFVWLTSMRTEWLVQLNAAHAETARRYGSPRPMIAMSKLDRRFPVDVGFDLNLGELRNGLDRASAHLQACAVVVDFGGFMGFTMRQTLRLIGATSKVPMTACSSVAEAVCWIEPYAAATTTGGFDRTYYVGALRHIEARLGSLG